VELSRLKLQKKDDGASMTILKER